MKNHASNGSSLETYTIMFFSCVVLFSARVLLYRSVETVKTVVWCSNVINGPKNCMLVRLIFLLYQRIGMCPGQTTMNKVTELLNRLTPNRARRCRPAQTPLIVWWLDHQPARVCLRHVPFIYWGIFAVLIYMQIHKSSIHFPFNTIRIRIHIHRLRSFSHFNSFRFYRI